MEANQEMLSKAQQETANSEVVNTGLENAEKEETVVSEAVQEEIQPVAEVDLSIAQPEPEETAEPEESTPVEAVTDAATEVVEEPKSSEPSLEEAFPIIPEINAEEKEEDIDTETEEEIEIDESIDYSNLSEVELINTLRELVEKDDYSSMVGHVENIRVTFYKRHRAKLQEQKDAFLLNGGLVENFIPEEDPYEADLKELLRQYRNKKNDFNKEQENEREENLKKKYEIIEEIKNLVNRKESINKTFQEFRDLQQKWREIGLVPQASMKDLWETYHHHVENFYDYIKINKELRDLDLKRNMEEKISLCEKAEALILEQSVLKAFNTLQKYHEQWREIGPVPSDKRDEIWERFKAATTQINKMHQDYFENRKVSQKKNLDAKVALCEKAEEILQLDIKLYKDWEEKSNEIIELQKCWRTIGYTPKKENGEIYERFRKACDSFFDKKREFYSKLREDQNNNLQRKIDLCVQAEALKDSTDWKKTTDDLISIQKKWKEIGSVPPKQTDVIWKRFRSACDAFFNNKMNHFNAIDSEQEENLKLKRALIEEVANFTSIGNDAENFEKLREFQRRWTEIGHVPMNEKDTVQKKFREAINKQFDKLRVEDKERNLMRFKSKISDLQNTNKGSNKIYAERDKYVSKLKQLETDLITLKNNIGFFAQSKNAEALIKDVKRKIERNEEQITYLKDKIRMIDRMDSSED